MAHWQRRDNCALSGIAHRMAPTARALGMAVGVFGDVMNHIVVARRAHSGRDVIEIQGVAQLPRDDVIGARGVAAQTNGADQFSSSIV